MNFENGSWHCSLMYILSSAVIFHFLMAAFWASEWSERLVSERVKIHFEVCLTTPVRVMRTHVFDTKMYEGFENICGFL